MKRKSQFVLLFSTIFYTTIYAKATPAKFAEEIPYTLQTQEKKICIHRSPKKSEDKDNSLCLEYRLETPELNSLKLNEQLKNRIEQSLKPYFKIFDKKCNQKDELKEFEDNFDVKGRWYEHIRLVPYAYTDSTYTLLENRVSYTGGAHGHNEVIFHLYDKKNNKELELKDIFNKSEIEQLIKIAEKKYREEKKLKPTDSMKKAGWFKDKFQLTNNFCLTYKGMLFYYNSYEVQPYAEGHTEIFLTNKELSSIIKNNPYFASKKPFFQSDVGEDLTIYAYTIDSDTIELKVVNTSKKIRSHKTWLSLSFPSLELKKSSVQLLKSDFEIFHVYEKGRKIFNKTVKKNIKAKYPLLEAEGEATKDKGKKVLDFKINIPRDIKNIQLYIRATYKDKNETITSPNNNKNIGQQGYANYQISIPVEK